ncbi:hypothetical protein [Steroidobacter cummioxidans]|uniref:hypothetical protein n=1 Tax=Steroidobacter cummioxidans TaxID=1803913 RepID=UPI000E321FF4|nr:hypothetical protein [Steroidobacter cummioxidans]
MNDIMLALKNPAWWVLTVVVGLALNAVAPFVNRWIESVWAARSEKRRQLVSAEDAEIKQTVAELASNPTGLIEVRLDTIYWTVRIILILCIYLMAIQLCFSIPMPTVQLLVAPLSLAAFFSIMGLWRKCKRGSRIHSDLQRELRHAGHSV